MRREERRPVRRRERREVDDEEDLPEACYAVSADQEELDTDNSTTRDRRNDDYSRYSESQSPRRRRREPGGGVFGVRTVGNIGRSNRYEGRYYGPGGDRERKRKEIVKEEAPYEGPTIFDKVFKTKKKGEDEEHNESRGFQKN